jgi:signal transduction histidine kinase
MKLSTERLKTAVEYLLPWAVLAILVVYTYADFFAMPYGFAVTTPAGTIRKVFVNEREPTLHEGDQLVRVGLVSLQAFNNDLHKDLFDGAQRGDVVPITVRRGNQTLTVDWRLPGTNGGEQRDQFLGPWLLAYVFWTAGTTSLLVLRPKDARWFLMAAFNFVTAVWLVVSTDVSVLHTWNSALVLRCAFCMTLPLYLHLHWVFPKPLGRLPRGVLAAVYALGGTTALLQWFQLVPEVWSFRAFLVAVIGSVILLAVHGARQPDLRRDLRFLMAAATLAIAPSVAVGILSAFEGTMPPATGLALWSLPLLPLAYLYAAHRQRLGGLELRVNRLITIYTFVILLGGIIVPLLVILDSLPRYMEDQALITGIIVSILATAFSLLGYPVFQRYAERRFLGIAVPSRELQQTYAFHITSRTSFGALTRLLDEQIMPSLLVRQFAFLLVDNGSTRVLTKTGVNDGQIPVTETRAVLALLAGKQAASGLSNDSNLSWIRLVLPLQVESNVLGFWLFGRRDPDDVYSIAEIPVLQSFANQTAVALSNILQSERLRAMYQANINRHENERRSLARELHDRVLSELGGMFLNTDMSSMPTSFQEGYRALTQRLRDIVSELRPPMLNYGLKPAIEALADSVMERNREMLNVVVDLESSGDRYPADKEQHLFRIVQEACENAVRHSRCRQITIAGQLARDAVELTVEDDGCGFEAGTRDLGLYDLVSQKHYGLAGMFERAELIDADIRLRSRPGVGTRVVVQWPRR